MNRIIMIVILTSIFITSTISLGIFFIVNASSLYIDKEDYSITLNYQDFDYKLYEYELNEVNAIEYTSQFTRDIGFNLKLEDNANEDKIVIRTSSKPSLENGVLKIDEKKSISSLYNTNVVLYTSKDLSLKEYDTRYNQYVTNKQMNRLIEELKRNNTENVLINYYGKNYNFNNTKFAEEEI